MARVRRKGEHGDTLGMGRIEILFLVIPFDLL